MHDLSAADLVWNRACEGDCEKPRVGDIALADVLLFHGPAMNGGVLHALQCLTPNQVNGAIAGFRFFGLVATAKLLERSQTVAREEEAQVGSETAIDQDYCSEVPDDTSLVERFEACFRERPTDFAPLNSKP
jgi:hypothetical protein